ncbi:hypothetical protein GCM10011571_07360 [Marinithermofilum abyssi]|uniref:BPL/LPL catalytic domain-containing protein n=1 Tax=Marinithermofilum abyssi TaxID=1571185 RepID=A0A8J2YCJ2_9BACL|nr:lipoate--protein ligase family protein [Marinithermofilum abyssi]GGE08581.1 hypothetical protein GCM10011571_07360 [Marinithermofilum abyssi]
MEQIHTEERMYQEIKEWRVLWDDTPPTALSYAMEEALGRAVARQEAPATLRIWQGPQAIAVAKKDVLTPQAQQAAAMMKEVGWPVFVRQSGGTAVPHGPGTLNLSLFLPRPKDQRYSIDDVYRMLGLPLQKMLADTFGLDGYFAEVPGSFCDGRYNVVVDGKKLAGTSQVWKGGPAGLASRKPGYILAHATFLTHQDPKMAVSALNAFYEMAEGTRPVQLETVGTLAEFAGHPSVETLERQVREGLLQAIAGLTGVTEISVPSEKERAEAEAFVPQCDPRAYRKK